MQQSNIANIIFLIIKSTPVYIWFLLLFLIHRGIKMSQEGPVKMKTSLIVPIIFVTWGIYNIISKFDNIAINLLSFLVLFIVGIYLGFKLYRRYSKVYLKENIIYRSRCILPLITVIINFLVKYILNVILYKGEALAMNVNFTLSYSGISGISTGLFFGSIIYTYMEVKKISNKEI